MKLVTNTREVLFDIASIREYKGPKVKQVAKEMLKMLFFKYSLSGESHEFIFINTVNRDDHTLFFNKLYELCDYDKGFLRWSRRKGINVANIVNFVRFLINYHELSEIQIPSNSDNYNPSRNIISLNWYDKITLYIRLIINKSMKYAIGKYDWGNCNNLIVLFDIGEPEHFIVNIANEKKVNTITASHGIFPPGFNYLIRGDYNQWNAPSKYIMTWGRSTSELFKKYSPGIRPVICGTVHISDSEYYPDSNLIGIVGEIHAHSEYNQRMIDIAEAYACKYGKHVYIRLHPGDTYEHYRINPQVSEFRKDINNAYVIIACMSTMLFTYMAQGRHVLRYSGNKETFFDIPNEISFDNLEDFVAKVERIDSIDFKLISQYFIDSIGEESANKYRLFFDTIHMDYLNHRN